MTDEHPIDRANREALANDPAWIDRYAPLGAEELKAELLTGAGRLVGGDSKVLPNQSLAGSVYERVELYYQDAVLFLDFYETPNRNLNPCPVLGIWLHKPERTAARYFRVVPAVSNSENYRWQDVTNTDPAVMFDSDTMVRQIFHWLICTDDFPSLQFSTLGRRRMTPPWIRGT